jgi:hypothetical protein
MSNNPSSNGTLQGVANEIPNVSATRIETPNHVVNLRPRISATKLAEYVVADPSRKLTITKQAKLAQKAIMIPYSRVRSAFPDSLEPEGISTSFLNARAADAESHHSENPWQQGDNIRSAAALRHLAALADQLECKNAQHIHRPEGGWGPLMINGVRVSVQPELVFTIEHRGSTKVGAIILNTGKNENLSLARAAQKFTVGDYLTVLVMRMLESRLKGYGVPLHTRCHAIDIFRDKIYTAPASFKTLLKHIEASCTMIALQWPTIPLEIDSEADALVVGAE